MQNPRVKLAVGLGVVLLILLPIALSSLQALRHRSQGILFADVVPDDAVVMLGDKRIGANRNVYVDPGNYTVLYSRSGFESATMKATITKGKTTKQVINLVANSDEGRKWLDEHPNLALRGERESGQAHKDTFEAAAEKLPLIRYLPFIDLQWRVDYGASKLHPDDPTTMAIYVKYWSEQGKIDALEWIRFKGFDPDKLEIIYRQGTNTFSE